MTLRLHDTAAGTVRDFHPRHEGVATMYLCGATVQSAPHIGHIRGAVTFDILWRWLEQHGHRVTYVRNVTDIEDKVIAKAHEQKIHFWDLAMQNERAFQSAYATLGCRPPTYEPRATGHITEINALIQQLIENGNAYAAGGDVYFDVSSWPQYGELSHQDPANMLPSDDAAGHKRDPRDFALWKAAKEGEPWWDSPWGPGRPGWHIECSAMCAKYLGTEFDIHGAGRDLVFPHNENEVAQSKAAGHGFAKYWIHNGWVVDAKGDKMSKSLGNSLLVTEALTQVRPVVLRYYLAQPHYRSTINASVESMHEAGTAYERLEGFVRRATELVGPVELNGATHCADFVHAMDDDLGVPQAIAAVHDVVREGNKALEAGDKTAVRGALTATRSMLDILGLDPLDPVWGGDQSDLAETVDKLVSLTLEQREAARQRKDYAAADAIRDQLTAAGITIEDTPSGPRWTR